MDDAQHRGGLWRDLAARLRRAPGALASLGALGLGIWAQGLLDERAPPAVAGLMYLAAAALFLLGQRGRHVENDAPAVMPAPQHHLPWPYLAAAILLGALAFPRLHGNRFRLDGALLWLAALLILGAASWDGLRGAPRRLLTRLAALRDGVRLSRDGLVLLSIVAVGALLRLHRIAEIPQEMGCDMPHVYVGIQSILDGEWPVFFPSHPGREGLFHYLAAPLAAVFGLSHTTIKVASALVGLATLPALYALGRELYGRTVGLLSAYLLAVSHWHVILSRRGLRAITMPLFLILAWLWLVGGLRTGRRSAFFLAGLFLGLGLYTYNAFLAVPGLAVLLVAGEMIAGRGVRVRRNAWNLTLAFVVMVVVFIPLGRYAYEEPRQYIYRTATRLTGLERSLPTDLLRVVLDNTVRSLLMFNVRGDIVFAANVPYLRELGFFTAVFFVLGTMLALWRWRRGHNLGVLLALSATLAPTALSLAFPDEVPNATRAIGALPSAMLLAALGLVSAAGGLREGLSGFVPRRYTIAVVALGAAALLAAEGWGVVPTYFHDFRLAQPRSNYAISLDMARTMDAFPGEAYIVVWPHWYDGNAVRAEFRRTAKDWHNEVMELAITEPPLAVRDAQVLVLVHAEDAEAHALLREAFPRGVGVTHYDYEGRPSFVAFYGER